VRKFSLFVLEHDKPLECIFAGSSILMLPAEIIDRITSSVSLQCPIIFSALCFITNHSLYNLFLFSSLFFFKSYYFMSLNQVISHSISNKLYIYIYIYLYISV
jgi:hypothetical protein